MRSIFVEAVRVKFQGGRGGNGCVSMLSLFANEFAGPDGGNGGNGGHIVLQASSQIKSLNHIASLYKGQDGVPGQGKHLFGANAKHTFVKVPVGTIVTPARPMELAEHEFNPNESDIIADLDVDGSMFIAARGGAGGRGNASFLSNTNRHPRVAEMGAEGDGRCYELRMKLYAHVGLIGLPNAGKSTLLKTLTGAKVKVGDYAFTTLHPQVGVIEFDDFTQVAISDLPGLIEDSHRNRGLGLQFLRSLQKCACLLYMIDLSAEDPIEQFETLVKELELFKKGMSWKSHLVMANKIDQPGARENLIKFREHLAKCRPQTELVVGSASRGDGLEELRSRIRSLHEAYQAANSDEDLGDRPLVW